jgi:hypothetical protein
MTARVRAHSRLAGVLLPAIVHLRPRAVALYTLRSRHMSLRLKSAVIALPILLAGCTNSAQYLQQMQPEALAEAQRRGAFEMNCPQATASLLSSETMQPAIRTFAISGPQRAVYNVGVSGCGKRTTYVVICPENGDNTCFDGGSRIEIQQD